MASVIATSMRRAVVAGSLAVLAGFPASAQEPTADALGIHYDRVPLGALGASPKRFHNHPLEIPRVKCLRGGPDEYRCVPAQDGDLTFILRAIEPAASREIIDRDCTDLAETLRRSSCTVLLRLVPRTELNMEVRGIARTIIGAPVGYVSPSRR